jgi:hypothetical protein
MRGVLRKVFVAAVLAWTGWSSLALAGGEPSYSIIDQAATFFAGRQPEDLPPQYRNHCGITNGHFYCSHHCGPEYQFYYCSRLSFGCCRPADGYCDYRGYLRCRP